MAGWLGRAFGALARRTVDATGSPWAFGAAVAMVAAWGLAGPLFGFSAEWQLAINTGTTIATFLMVFLIQHAQNRDTKAIHIKLNEVIAALSGADNELIAAERLDDAQLSDLGRRFQELGQRLQRKGRLRSAASVALVPSAVVVEEKVTKEVAPARRGGRGRKRVQVRRTVRTHVSRPAGAARRPRKAAAR